MNSLKTCMAPCTESKEGDDKSVINESSRSGYSSGQSQIGNYREGMRLQEIKSVKLENNLVGMTHAGCPDLATRI